VCKEGCRFLGFTKPSTQPTPLLTPSQHTNRPQTNAVGNAGWLEAPTTGTFEYGLDSDDGSDFAMSFNGATWDNVAHW
jgi:hypothetical protein